MRTKVLLILFLAVCGKSLNAQPLQGISLLPADTQLFKPNTTSVAITDVANQPFKKAYRISTLNQTGDGSYTLRYNVDASVNKGDVFLLSFYTRSLQSKKETGQSFFEVGLDRMINGKYEWPPLFERGLSFGSAWQQTQIPFVAARDVKNGELAFVIKPGNFSQVFEVGGISLSNHKQSVQLAGLPRSVVRYGGDEPTAAWRKDAADRIEKYRKGDLAIRVVDKNGKPVSNASVEVHMKRNAYAWGTATASSRILDTANPAFQKYRDTLLRYFNTAVFDMEMKSKIWDKTDHQRTFRGLAWLKKNGIPVRGHVMVWPGWPNSPHLVKFKNDTAALRAAILKNIEDETSLMGNQFIEWDVINEPFTNHDIIDSLGGDKVMVDWFKAARKHTPGVKLFLNDFTMFHTQGKGSQNFYDNIQFLLDHGAPLEGIGEQAHIGGTAPGIDFIIERLNRFAAFKLPIEITEFDITSDDDDFKSRYIRDFFTAVYSHPSTTGILQWGFWEGAHWIPAGALWDKDWNIRPAGKVFTELVSRTWNTHEKGSTTKNGMYKVRGFTGDYEVTVKHKGIEVKKATVLTTDGQILTMMITD